MTRPKTITDDAILTVAREVFRAHGHAASTRQIAERAGISEGVLYQRFGSKHDLFFAAMAATTPDVDGVLGPDPPEDEPRDFLLRVLERLADHFDEVLPLAIRVITHPSFGHGSLRRAPGTMTKLSEGLARRLARFERAGALRRSTAEPTARLLVSLAHDWALGRVMSGESGARRTAEELAPLVDVVWNGARRRAR